MFAVCGYFAKMFTVQFFLRRDCFMSVLGVILVFRNSSSHSLTCLIILPIIFIKRHSQVLIKSILSFVFF